MTAPQTVADALRLAVHRLQAAGFGAGDARPLLAHALGLEPARLTLHLNEPITDSALAAFDLAISARLRHQPVAQIIGHRMFWRHSFIVTSDTLDPRPETETLVAEALRGTFQSVLDLGTGTGCILLSLLAERPEAHGTGADISPAALQVAARNAAALGLDHRVEWVQSDWFSRIKGQFDLIVSNPPYIAADEMAHLSKDVLNWEPHLALTPGGDGLEAYRQIALGAPLVAGGRILLEIGPTQGAAVSKLLSAQGFEAIRILPDLDGRDRVVCAQKPQDAGSSAA
jgi:release factor glutamine methyltransferase